MCAKSDVECGIFADQNTLPNGCSLNKPYRCSDEEGDCEKDLSSCDFEKSCPTETPILCADNTCAVNATICRI